MPNQDKNKPSRKDRLRTIIAGLQKHFPSGSLILVNETLSPTQLVQRIQQDIDTSDGAIAAHAAWIEKVQLERASHAKLAPTLRALHAQVVAKFGDTKDAAGVLGDFGYLPRKAGSRTAVNKAQAAANNRATRAARHTMGKVQKKKVKGTAAPEATPTPPVATPNAAPTPPVAAGPSATVPTAPAPGTSPGSAGTVRPNA